MCEIDKRISELEAVAQKARLAIMRSKKRQDRLAVLLFKERERERRTREQHLDRPNRMIAELWLLKADLGDPLETDMK